MPVHNGNTEYRTSPAVSDADLKQLFQVAWGEPRDGSFEGVLSRSLVYVCAFEHDRLIGFVNVAWDGGVHAFLLDTTVAPDFRNRGIGRELVRLAGHAAARAGVKWLHVDYEPHLDGFYRGCGFSRTEAGLLRLSAMPT